MNSVRQFRDAETLRQQRNLTKVQRRTNSDTIEGVVVNNIAKQPQDNNITELYDTLVISKNLTYPTQIIMKKPDAASDNSLKKLALLTTGLFTAIGASTYILASAAKKKATLPHWKTLPELPRNIALNEETHFATYAMLQNPNTKTILGAIGVFVLTAAGAIGKNFADGFKEIWVKKKEANVQRDLQENLIAVETKTFSGKMQIQRAMLSKTAKMFEKYLSDCYISDRALPSFKNFISFGSKQNKQINNEKESNFLKSWLLGGATVSLMALLTHFSLKNIQKTAKNFQAYEENMKKIIENLISKEEAPNISTLEQIKKTLITLGPKEAEIREMLKNIKIEKSEEKQNYIKTVVQEVGKITQEAAEAIAGKPGWKASYYSHVNDVRGHFYNWIVNFDNSLLGYLFGGLTAVTALGYCGKQALDGMKQAEVIKANAETELNLQKKLVEVELKNFYAKKSSVVKPLIDEFLAQAQSGKDKCKLKTMAENILLEIKNGPPFVYS